eukprot:CAMPEP_0202033678 /NCGR_PEP_ID=MMETSP0905-20130828/66170_1 /ASSEMBLY_ACC=CAM_ASM_000554 /TAXON_ID=420261 /ORGANISM="Thalassiosira antarctica, Strain CCMP982" /LENGTH=1263 /DNA_ID=CAMNT_0048597589 /DNA_START=136 /DNA_END=3927 /DNA_ORIENTATION=+
MSGSNKPLTTTAIRAAVITAAALSAYWITSSNSREENKSKSDRKDDLQLLLNRFDEMKLRLDRMEKESSNKQDNKQQVSGKESSKSRGKSNSRKQHHSQHGQTRDPEVDSNANVLPPPHSDDEEGSDNHETHAPPQTIVTKATQDRASQFLLPRQDSKYSHTSTPQRGQHTTAASTESTRDALHAPIPIVLISDPGQDLDDEMMFIMARHLVSLELISLQGVIANLSPSFARARLTRGTLDLLGLHRVPVGIGTDGGDLMGKHSSEQFETTASSYIIHTDGEAARGLESGHRLLQTLYDAASDIEYVDVIDEDGDMDDEGGEHESQNTGGEGTPKSNNDSPRKQKTKKVAKGGLTIVVTSSMKDIAIFVRDNPTLFASKTREVVVMGGCKPVPIVDTKASLLSTTDPTSSHCSASHVWSNLATIECEPDSAHNNTFDGSASAFFYSQCQKMNITLTVVSRYAAYAAKMPRSVYDDLALTGSSIGWRLRNSQRASIDQLWKRACSADPEIRKGLPPRCDRKWFIATFCGGDDDPSRCCADTAWDLVTGFMQYDTIALLAAIPAVREKYFDPFVMPPLQKVPNQEEKIESLLFDLSEVPQEGDKTVTAERRRSSMATGCDDGSPAIANKNKQNIIGGGYKKGRRLSCPGPRAIQRAIARATEDNKYVETPFENPGSNVPVPFDRGTRNLIGVSDKEHNLKDPSLLVNLLKTGYREGIMCNHHTQPHIILHLQLRWDNLADTLLTCLMLRSLWDMRLASVLGVIVSLCPGDSKQAKRPPDGVSVSDVEEEEVTEGGDKTCNNKQRQHSDITTESTGDEDSNKESKSKTDPVDKSDPSILLALAESIRATLCSIGLSHVKFVIVSGDSMTEHKRQSTEAFRELYESAPPIGVTLVLTATFTSVWPFAEKHPDLFRNKTVRVVHTGGALIWPARWGWATLPSSHKKDDQEDSDDIFTEKGNRVTSEQILVPDPAAQNHRLDMSSARLFYKRAQALSVPMVILSRHVAKECCIPRNFFDVLGSHGGEVGKRIYKSERDSLINLWKCSCAPSGSAARGNLPERCDAHWFADNFCAGKMASSEEEVWQSVEAVNLYSPIALLAALPGETVRSYFQTMPFPVRSATHHVIGLTEEVPPLNVTNPSELRSLVVQSLLSAALANESEFGQDAPPMVPIRMGHEERGWRGSARRGSANLTNSVVSTVSFTGGNDVDEDDMWTFSEAARREIFSRTVAQTSKNAVMQKEKKRKFVGMTTESRQAATNGFIPPEENN